MPGLQSGTEPPSSKREPTKGGCGALTALGLHALQHRGQEATGIVTFDGEQFHAHRGNGHVSENFGAHSNGNVSRL